MEHWDVLDENGHKTGRTAVRGQIKDGDYALYVHIFLYTPEGGFLIQKRSILKDTAPGVWDVTGGGVLAGEESRDAAVRETAEEIGIPIQPDELCFVRRLRRTHSFVDIWAVKKEFRVEDCVLQQEEVDDVRVVTGEELLQTVRNTGYRSKEYIDTVAAFIRTVC